MLNLEYFQFVFYNLLQVYTTMQNSSVLNSIYIGCSFKFCVPQGPLKMCKVKLSMTLFFVTFINKAEIKILWNKLFFILILGFYFFFSTPPHSLKMLHRVACNKITIFFHSFLYYRLTSLFSLRTMFHAINSFVWI